MAPGLDTLAIEITADNKKAVKVMKDTMAVMDQLTAKWAKQFEVIKSGGLEKLMNTKVNVSNIDRAAIQVERAKQRIAASLDSLSTNRFAQQQFKQMFDLGVVQQVPQKLSKFDKAMKDIFSPEELEAMAAKQGRALAKNEMFAKKGEKAFTNLNKAMHKASMQQPPFAGWAMSLMFAGMALQRMSTQLMQFGTKAFNEVAHSVEGTVTASDKLDGSMKYLGYTIGEAMQPAIEWLIPIVDTISEWVSENEGLVAGLIVTGIVLGTLLSVGGSLKLAIDGFSGSIKILTGLLPTVTSAAGATSIAWAAVGAAFLVIAAIVVAVIVLWQSNLGGFQDYVKSTFGAIWETIKAVFFHLWQIVKTVMAIVVAIFKGDWNTVLDLLGKFLTEFAALFLKALLGVGVLIVNIFSLAWNTVVDIVLKIMLGLMFEIQQQFIKMVSWVIEKAAEASDWLGLGRGIFDTALEGLKKMDTGLASAQEEAAKLADKLHLGYLNSEDLKSSFNKVDDMLGLTKEITPSTVTNTAAASTGTNITNNINIEKMEANDNNAFLESLKRYGVNPGQYGV